MEARDTDARFNPGPPLQGMRTQPGLPLIGVYLASALAPLTFLTTVIMDRAHPTDAVSLQCPARVGAPAAASRRAWFCSSATKRRTAAL